MSNNLINMTLAAATVFAPVAARATDMPMKRPLPPVVSDLRNGCTADDMIALTEVAEKVFEAQRTQASRAGVRMGKDYGWFENGLDEVATAETRQVIVSTPYGCKMGPLEIVKREQGIETLSIFGRVKVVADIGADIGTMAIGAGILIDALHPPKPSTTTINDVSNVTNNTSNTSNYTRNLTVHRGPAPKPAPKPGSSSASASGSAAASSSASGAASSASSGGKTVSSSTGTGASATSSSSGSAAAGSSAGSGAAAGSSAGSGAAAGSSAGGAGGANAGAQAGNVVPTRPTAAGAVTDNGGAGAVATTPGATADANTGSFISGLFGKLGLN